MNTYIFVKIIFLIVNLYVECPCNRSHFLSHFGPRPKDLSSPPNYTYNAPDVDVYTCQFVAAFLRVSFYTSRYSVERLQGCQRC